MKAVVYSFTRRGAMLSINIGEALQKFDFEVRCLTMPKFAEEKIFLEAMDDHNKACEYAFKECQLIVFVGAVGIAVRTIAPYIKNKLVDPAVLSVDEGGNFVIPLLSGHIGGANGFAKVLAKVIKATPVVTTATDVNKLFAVDEWAARNNMIINSMKAEELQNAAGEFSSSDFVKSVVGVSNVCERSAVLAANNGSIISSKCSLNGVTLAVAEADIVLDFEKLS